MTEKVQTPQQHWKDFPNLYPIYFSILIFLYSSHPLTFVLSLWQSYLFYKYIILFHTSEPLFLFLQCFPFPPANFYSYPKVQFKFSILHAEHSRFPWAELEVWHSVLLGVYFCCSLFILLKIICLHACLSYFNNESETCYGEGNIFTETLCIFKHSQN